MNLFSISFLSLLVNIDSVRVAHAVPAAEALRVSAGVLREAEGEAALFFLRAVFFVFFSMSLSVRLFFISAGAGGDPAGEVRSRSKEGRERRDTGKRPLSRKRRRKERLPAPASFRGMRASCPVSEIRSSVDYLYFRFLAASDFFLRFTLGFS